MTLLHTFWGPTMQAKVSAAANAAILDEVRGGPRRGGELPGGDRDEPAPRPDERETAEREPATRPPTRDAGWCHGLAPVGGQLQARRGRGRSHDRGRQEVPDREPGSRDRVLQQRHRNPTTRAEARRADEAFHDGLLRRLLEADARRRQREPEQHQPSPGLRRQQLPVESRCDLRSDERVAEATVPVRRRVVRHQGALRSDDRPLRRRRPGPQPALAEPARHQSHRRLRHPRAPLPLVRRVGHRGSARRLPPVHDPGP